jgi:phage baseplate assembly protein V
MKHEEQHSDRRYHGVYPAIVAAVGDSQHPGQVRLRLDWFDSQMQTEWCRICNPYAGNGYGFVWHPEPGDEVLVAFMHGDMRWPIVLGGMYNGVDEPPTARTDARDQKLMRTKGGHELLMDDSAGQQRVRLASNGGHTVDIDDQAGTIVIATSGGVKVTLDDGGASVVIEAGAIKLGGDAATQPLVLGQALLAAFNAHTHNCTAPGSPSGPPVPPLTSAVLSTISKTT